jgi:hypothetical protein
MLRTNERTKTMRYDMMTDETDRLRQMPLGEQPAAQADNRPPWNPFRADGAPRRP